MATAKKHEWTEAKIQQAIRMQIFKGAFTLVPNCSWTGNEADMLIVDKSLRLIDIEIKISRADFKADSAKEKWWEHLWNRDKSHGAPKHNEWPNKIWKHYYAVPREIWNDDMLDFMPSKNSGILIITKSGQIGLKNHPKPNKSAPKLEPHEVFDICRLGNFRMWNAIAKAERLEAQIQNGQSTGQMEAIS